MSGADLQHLNWLVTNFARSEPHITNAVVVSSDGLLLAMSEGLERGQADQLAAITSGMVSLTRGASRCFDTGTVEHTLVQMAGGVMIIMSISDGSSLAVLAGNGADIGFIAHEMGQLVRRVGAVLTPELRRELQAALPAV